MAPKPRLTEDRAPYVQELLSSMTVKEAAVEVGLSAAMLKKYIKRWGLKPRGRVLFKLSESAVTDYKSGKTIEELSRGLSVSRETVRDALLRAGVKLRKKWSRTRGRVPTKEDVDQMAALAAEGKTLREIGKLVGLAFTTVRKYLDQRGVTIERRPSSFDPRDAYLKRMYGISRTDEDRMMKEQGGRCAICGALPGSPRNQHKEVLCVDHDHLTGKVRQMICMTCNIGLSYFRDCPDIGYQAAHYVARHAPLEEKEVKRPAVGADILDYLYRTVPEVHPGVRLLDPYKWNADLLSEMGFSNRDIQHCLRLAHLEEPKTQWVFECELPSAVGRTRDMQSLSARQLSVREVTTSDANKVYKASHIQGGLANAKVSYGLFTSDDRLVAAMSFNDPSSCRSTRRGMLLQRFACMPGLRIRGGAGKLLKAVQEYDRFPILSYSDNRYSDGGLYRALGFTQIDTQDVDYLYYKDGQIFNKSQLQKSRTASKDDPRTEYEIARSLGYLRIYNAGKRVWARR